MVRAVCKRKSDPQIVQKLWLAINNIRSQKQVANLDRICRSMMRDHDMNASDVDIQLKYAVEDELIVAYRAMSQKGSNAGFEQDGFRVNSHEEVDEQEKPDHDWYCYDCHKGGDVIECSECWRVYHENCINDDLSEDSFVCMMCKSKELHFFCGADQGLNRFVFFYMDLNMMQEKANNRKYKYLEQFYADALTILHNIFICYGDNGVLPHLVRVMIRDCKYDLDEIRQCKDCYFHSNAKPREWFCQPCRPRHELVFAKQKGFSYWPAKVIKITSEGYDVRFFGSQHQRAVITQNNIKPIDTNPKQLSLKRTVGFNKAMKELTRHQELLEHASLETPDEQSGGENEMDDEQLSEKSQEKDEPVEKLPKIHHKKFHKKRHSEPPTCVSSSFKLTTSRISVGAHEDNYVVTSSEDKIRADVDVGRPGNIGKKPGFVQRLAAKSTQTDMIREDFSDLSALLPSGMNLECSGEPGKCDCESKNIKIIKEVIEKMELKFEQEKRDALEKLESKLWKESEEEQQKALNRVMTSQQRELERVQGQMEKMRDEHTEELKQLSIKHKKEISVAKKKQWCYYCEEEAMYHCCWNTSYCSIKCQQDHWHMEHKRMCRRKRN